jgi:hypothetical protein
VKRCRSSPDLPPEGRHNSREEGRSLQGQQAFVDSGAGAGDSQAGRGRVTEDWVVAEFGVSRDSTVKANSIIRRVTVRASASRHGSSILGFSGEPQFFGEMQIPK